ncbi:MAG: hypothetical protein Tsb0034_11600 [Ekhidna sp.]
MNKLIVIALAVVVAQSLLFSVYLYRSAKRDAKSRLLMLFTSILSLHFFNLILGRLIPHYSGFWFSWMLLASYGPVIYLYVREFLNRPADKSWIHLFFPFYPTVLWAFTDKLHMESSDDVYFDTIVSLPIYGALFLYLLLSIHLINRYGTGIKNISWLKYLVVSFTLVLLFHIVVLSIYSTSSIFYGQLFYLFEAIYMTFFTSGMVYTAMSKPSVFIDTTKVKELLLQPKKYFYTGLTKEDTERIIQQVTQYMENAKPYLDSEITLDSFSKETGINRRHISQAINEKRNQNFKEFVNHYRISHARELLNDAEKDLRIFEVMYEVGFSSKSSFNQAFKRITNKTPTEYRNEVLRNSMRQTA